MLINLINLPSMPKSIKHKASPKCSKEKVIYKYEYSEKYGCPRRVANGKIDIQQAIQSYADDVDFKAIGKMLVDTRDNVVSHFTDVNGEIQDVTGLPRNIHEYEALHNKIKSSYEELPNDLKALFNDDFEQFKQSWMSGNIGSVMDAYYKSQAGVTQTTQESEAN